MEEDDVIGVLDPLMREVLAVGGVEVPDPVRAIAYDEAMLRYGTDRPDRRIPIEIADLSEVFASSEFKVFSGALGAAAWCAASRRPGEFPRKRFDELTERAQTLRGEGAGVGRGRAGRLALAGREVPLARRRSPAWSQATGAKEGDAILAVADDAAVAARVLGDLRLEVGEPAEGDDLLWVVDFPMFEWDDEGKRWDPMHHPFTAPSGRPRRRPRHLAQPRLRHGLERRGDRRRLDPHHPTRRADARCSTRSACSRGGRARAVRLPARRARATARRPTAAWRSGIDRIVALLAGRETIRDVIAFPKTASGMDPLTGAPGAGGRRASSGSWAAVEALASVLSVAAAARACAPAGATTLSQHQRDGSPARG